ncbi:hypothetical protein Acr_22g0008620 [Actinidia rufa]|uniref:Uncharacterized protein n=1 Tax=Actinidia rufa TaxID=165716 RepID=A0A7J0GL83_9ERIC|nr:hypothetical protein Acr_22g0008620 [Actinidia rufa]
MMPKRNTLNETCIGGGSFFIEIGLYRDSCPEAEAIECSQVPRALRSRLKIARSEISLSPRRARPTRCHAHEGGQPRATHAPPRRGCHASARVSHARAEVSHAPHALTRHAEESEPARASAPGRVFTRRRRHARATCGRPLTCAPEGHIKRDCPKYKAQDQSSDTAATAVMADEDEIDVLLAASDDGKSDCACEGRIWMATTRLAELLAEGRSGSAWKDGRDAVLRLVEEFSEFPKETRRCCGERRTRGYTIGGDVQTGGATVQHGVQWYLARRMDKESNRCTERSSEEGDQVDFEKLYSEGRGDAEASLFCSRFDQWRVFSPSCAHKGRRDGATTTRKVTYFAAHPGGGVVVRPSGGARHLGEKSFEHNRSCLPKTVSCADILAVEPETARFARQAVSFYLLAAMSCPF